MLFVATEKLLNKSCNFYDTKVQCLISVAQLNIYEMETGRRCIPFFYFKAMIPISKLGSGQLECHPINLRALKFVTNRRQYPKEKGGNAYFLLQNLVH